MSNHHGSTPAAWTAVIIALIGFCVGAIGLIMVFWPVFWVGVGLVAASVVVGKIMQVMGMGTT
jgi:hypothetical protein